MNGTIKTIKNKENNQKLQMNRTYPDYLSVCYPLKKTFEQVFTWRFHCITANRGTWSTYEEVYRLFGHNVPFI